MLRKPVNFEHEIKTEKHQHILQICAQAHWKYKPYSCSQATEDASKHNVAPHIEYNLRRVYVLKQ